MDGIELCQRIRDSTTLYPKPMVVALTAETSESLHRRCTAAGISHILYKPIAWQQLKSFFEKTCETLVPCRSTRQAKSKVEPRDGALTGDGLSDVLAASSTQGYRH